jgi:hypothetical protein
MRATVTIGGKEYRLGASNVLDYKAAEDHYLRQRRKAILQTILDLRESMPSDLWKDEWKAAVQRAEALKADANEVLDWFATNEGKAFATWRLVDREHPGEFPTFEAFVTAASTTVAELPADEPVATDAQPHE